MIVDRLAELIAQKQNPTALGLDTHLGCLPDGFMAGQGEGEALLAFNKALIDGLADIVPAVKVQIAYYEQYGPAGLAVYQKTLRYAREAGLIVIADAKRNDIGSTASAYASAFLTGADRAFDADFVTVNGYLGIDGVQPFIDSAVANDKGLFVLVKTSNPSSGDFQDLLVEGRPLYERVGAYVAHWGRDCIGASGYSRVGAVVGATYPAQGITLRQQLPGVFFLVPGYGAQGATAKDIAGCFDARGGGAIVNASRSIILAHTKRPGHFVDAARAAALEMKEALSIVRDTHA